MVRFRFYICLTVMLMIGLPYLTFSQTPAQLFQQGLLKENGEGDLKAALAIYERIVGDTNADRPLQVKALLHMGMCWEKLGKDEAKKIYRRVIQEFADQHEVVAEARTRLAALIQSANSANDSNMVVRRVWAGSEVDYFGSPSPDGQHLIFVDWETGNLAVRDLKTGENRHLTNTASWSESMEFALSSIISADGKQVAYAWFNEDLLELRLVGLDGSESRVLYRNEEVEDVQPYDWSPDGKKILAVFSRKDRTNQIVLVSVTDGSVTVLKTFDWRSPRSFLSPDGRFIAYDFPPQEDSPVRDIFLLAVDGSREIPLVQDPANDLLLGWAPDSKRVLFASDRTGTMAAWMIQIAEGKSQESPEVVKTDIGQISPMGFTRKGSFYYGIETGKSAVYIARFDITTGKLLAQPTKVTQRFVGWYTSIDWSPDGQYLAYIISFLGSSGIDSRSVSIVSLETGEEREVTPKLPYFYPYRPGWSPDGRSFLLPGRDTKGREGIYQIDAESGDVITIVQSEPGANSPFAIWSHDGKTIFYIRSTQKTKTILVRDLESGREKELLRSSSVRGLDLSVDGRQLAFIMNDPATRSQVLKIMPAVGGESRELLKLQDPERFESTLAWTRDGSQLLFAKRFTTRKKEQRIELWRIHVESGETQKMELELAMQSLRGLRVHPDNQRIAFNAGIQAKEVWVMENFLPELKAAQ